MTNFLEELYYGNVDPQARGYRKGSHTLKVSKDINELEEKLTERLQGEDKVLFFDFCEVPLENTKQYPHIRRYKGMLNGHAFRYFFISAFIFSLAAVTARPTDCWLQCSIFPISL